MKNYQDQLSRESKPKPIVVKKTRNHFRVTRVFVLFIIGFSGSLWTTYKEIPYTLVFMLIMSSSVFLAVKPGDFDE